MAEAKPVTDTEFESEVLKSDLPVLVDFWAPWCGPCRMMAPVVDAVASKNEGKLKVRKMNTDENPLTPAKYNILGIPTLILFKDGREVERLVGYIPEGTLTEKITPHLV
ncbi:MAG: thioredoxin [candidate division WOR-3 bacterium]